MLHTEGKTLHKCLHKTLHMLHKLGAVMHLSPQLRRPGSHAGWF